MAKTIEEFYKEVIGKGFDVDGAYGYQCWDGYAYYSKWLGYPFYSCTNSGYVKDIWNNRKSSGILNYFDEVSPNKLKDGDVAIWTECTACPYSHIAIFRKDNKNGTGVFLGQNQGGANGVFNQASIPYNGIMGGLRPKCYVTPTVNHYIGYTCHVQDLGWQKEVYDGDTGGITGEGKRLEAFKIRTLRGGKVEFIKTHIENKGWVTFNNPTANTVIGTVGKGLRIEDIIIKLNNFKFRVHIEGSGWTDWSNCDGVASLGTVGQNLRIEAIQVKKK